MRKQGYILAYCIDKMIPNHPKNEQYIRQIIQNQYVW
jgi:hypothetical protein